MTAFLWLILFLLMLSRIIDGFFIFRKSAIQKIHKHQWQGQQVYQHDRHKYHLTILQTVLVAVLRTALAAVLVAVLKTVLAAVL